MDERDDGDHGTRRADGLFERSDPRHVVWLTADERRRFEEITRSMRCLRLTRGRRAMLLDRPWMCGLLAAIGAIVGIATLGRLPLAVPFASFVVTLVGVAEFTRLVENSRWWPGFRELLGLEVAS